MICFVYNEGLIIIKTPKYPSGMSTSLLFEFEWTIYEITRPSYSVRGGCCVL